MVKTQAQYRYQTLKYKLEHRCVSCGHPLPPERKQTHCESCIQRRIYAEKEKRIERHKQGLCLCGAPATLRKRDLLCEPCWFKVIALKRTGSRKNWQALKELFEIQDKRCAYTGKVLILGVNAVLDHIFPISRGGSKSMNNVQWVDKQINIMKQNFTHNEFLAIIKQIYLKLPL